MTTSASMAWAACGTKGCAGMIERIYMPNTDYIYIGTDEDETILNCVAVSGVYMTLNRSHRNFSEIYSAMLAAQHAGKEMYFRISEGSSNCSISYATSDL